jgi:hypothetical protein
MSYLFIRSVVASVYIDVVDIHIFSVSAALVAENS